MREGIAFSYDVYFNVSSVALNEHVHHLRHERRNVGFIKCYGRKGIVREDHEMHLSQSCNSPQPGLRVLVGKIGVSLPVPAGTL